MRNVPAKGATCATGATAAIARKKIKARGDIIRKGTSLKPTRIGKRKAWCTNVRKTKSK